MQKKLPNVKQITTKSKEIVLVSSCPGEILDVPPHVRSSGFLNLRDFWLRILESWALEISLRNPEIR